MSRKIFNQVAVNKPRRSAFDLGHERKFSMNMGELVPIMCEEVVPGDTFANATEVMMRLAPLVSPVMHRINVFTHFFFVPNRLVWDNWEDFITGGREGTSTPVLPYLGPDSMDIGSGKNQIGMLGDYLGLQSELPNSSINTRGYNVMPFKAYQKIYNDYYRDQNYEAEIDIVTSRDGNVGPELTDVTTLRTRNWEKDYFTSALPWTQRGGDVTIPLIGEADVVLTDQTLTTGIQQHVVDASRNPAPSTGSQSIDAEYDGVAESNLRIASAEPVWIDPNGSLEVDLTTVSGATIEELRRATRLQRWLEKNARSGSRYIEQIQSHFGVRSSDARLQRAEFLGGGKTPIVVSEVLQTSETGTTPQGEMTGHAIGVGKSHRFKKFFEEHGFVIGIMSVLPKTAYLTGTRRFFFKSDKFDYYWPEFAQLGEQAVLKGELFGDNTDTDIETWGYQSRYSEYKYTPSTCHGEFKDTLKFWHMARDITSLPALNNSFVQSDPTHRIFANTTPTDPKLYVQIYNNLRAIRPMPYFNIPKL